MVSAASKSRSVDKVFRFTKDKIMLAPASVEMLYTIFRFA